jgi:CheY-like chemotaxis protein
MNLPRITDASLLVASDKSTDAALVKRLLDVEFDKVFISTDAEQAVADFNHYRPNVLILAFNGLEKSERYYLGLFRHNGARNLNLYRAIVLCGKDEVESAYKLCREGIFDDYMLFWPMTNDAQRLSMSVHLALRDLRSLASSAPTATAPHLESLHTLNELAERISPMLLVVDDEAFQHKILGFILKEAHYQVMFASSVVEALDMLHMMELPDLILMDIMLPGVNGLEAVRQIKSDNRLAGIPVIMMTGKSDKEILKASMEAGACDFIVKPFASNILLSKLTHALMKQ